VDGSDRKISTARLVLVELRDFIKSIGSLTFAMTLDIQGVSWPPPTTVSLFMNKKYDLPKAAWTRQRWQSQADRETHVSDDIGSTQIQKRQHSTLYPEFFKPQKKEPNISKKSRAAESGGSAEWFASQEFQCSIGPSPQQGFSGELQRPLAPAAVDQPALSVPSAVDTGDSNYFKTTFSSILDQIQSEHCPHRPSDDHRARSIREPPPPLLQLPPLTSLLPTLNMAANDSTNIPSKYNWLTNNYLLGTSALPKPYSEMHMKIPFVRRYELYLRSDDYNNHFTNIIQTIMRHDPSIIDNVVPENNLRLYQFVLEILATGYLTEEEINLYQEEPQRTDLWHLIRSGKIDPTNSVFILPLISATQASVIAGHHPDKSPDSFLEEILWADRKPPFVTTASMDKGTACEPLVAALSLFHVKQKFTQTAPGGDNSASEFCPTHYCDHLQRIIESDAQSDDTMIPKTEDYLPPNCIDPAFPAIFRYPLDDGEDYCPLPHVSGQYQIWFRQTGIRIWSKHMWIGGSVDILMFIWNIYTNQVDVFCGEFKVRGSEDAMAIGSISRPYYDQIQIGAVIYQDPPYNVRGYFFVSYSTHEIHLSSYRSSHDYFYKVLMPKMEPFYFYRLVPQFCLVALDRPCMKPGRPLPALRVIPN
jgi:hypothetical protein